MSRDSLVIEGLVTTVNAVGQINIAPMGPRVDRHFKYLTLRPFKNSQTYQNLVQNPEGVFHIVDDVYLLAQAAVGKIEPWPMLLVSNHVNGYYLPDSCRYFAFRVDRIDDASERATIDVDIVWSGKIRDHVGFNRAMFAVIEASILATRLHLLPKEQILSEMDRLQPLVEKTGGKREHAAFDFLRKYVAEYTPPEVPET
ncbi:MAG: DUF447 family protein [Planctomycetia bacterium]|nr:DUF447 family protein [Planctomycetia bacterium]